MSATLLSGSDLAKERRAALKEAVNNFRTHHHVTPTLAILRVGDDEAAFLPGGADQEARADRADDEAGVS